MHIRSLRRFMESIPDWTPINDVLPERIRVTDLDGILERRGHFLVLDTKHPDSPIPRGQDILYQRLARIGMVVLVVYTRLSHHHNDAGEMTELGQMEVTGWWRYFPNGRRTFRRGDTAALQRFVQRWWAWADTNHEETV